MHLSYLELQQFRSYARLAVELAPGMVVLHGPNGSGKTNLLEAICVAAVGDSPRARMTEELVGQGSEHAYVRGDFVGQGGQTGWRWGWRERGRGRVRSTG